MKRIFSPGNFPEHNPRSSFMLFCVPASSSSPRWSCLLIYFLLVDLFTFRNLHVDQKQQIFRAGNNIWLGHCCCCLGHSSHVLGHIFSRAAHCLVQGPPCCTFHPKFTLLYLPPKSLIFFFFVLTLLWHRKTRYMYNADIPHQQQEMFVDQNCEILSIFQNWIGCSEKY
jgi:hypothetical protein